MIFSASKSYSLIWQPPLISETSKTALPNISKIVSKNCKFSEDWWEIWIVGRDWTKTKCPQQWVVFLLISRFGVCCLFIVSDTSTTISENCTYIQNPSYPSVYSDTSSLTYTIKKCSSSVCAVRLDFETFQIAGPTATTEATGGLCVGMVLQVAIHFRRIFLHCLNFSQKLSDCWAAYFESNLLRTLILVFVKTCGEYVRK